MERGEVAGVRGGAAGESPCARRTRTMKQCSSDARTMEHSTHSPLESTATGMGGVREGGWTRAVWPSPATYPMTTTGQERERERERKKKLNDHGEPEVQAAGSGLLGSLAGQVMHAEYNVRERRTFSLSQRIAPRE